MKHTDQDGVKMVDVGGKPETERLAIAEGKIRLKEGTIRRIEKKEVEKGNVLTTSQVAGILAVKRVPEIIPMCHPIPLDSIKINFDINENKSFIKAQCKIKANYKTGVEIEALNGVNIALLTIWDMVKSVEKNKSGLYPETEIFDVKVIRKEK